MPYRGSARRRGVIPRRLRVYRLLFVVAVLSALVLLARGRCQQLSGVREEALSTGIARLAQALTTGAPLDDAERAFRSAAGHSLGDPFPAFCLSAVAELTGRWAPPAAPAAWHEAIATLRAGELHRADAAFARLSESEPALSLRARSYRKLIAEMARAQALAPELIPETAAPPRPPEPPP